MNRITFMIVLLVVLFLARNWIPFPLFRLPGDIDWRTERFHLFVPITTCLLISLFASLVLALFARR